MAQLLKSWCVHFKLFCLLPLVLLLGCSADLPKPVFDHIYYDYKILSPYPLTKKHQYIAIVLDANDIELPDFPLKDESLPLKITTDINKAQVLVHVNVSDSFLIQRPNAIRNEVIFPENEKGYVERYEVLRGFIRTHYSIEIIDVLNNALIYDRQGAINHEIETRKLNNRQENVDALKTLFFEETPAARYGLISDVLNQLQQDDFNVLRVQFKQDTFKVVKSLKGETNFEKAFEILQGNNKQAGRQALDVYNIMLKFYENKNDELSQAVMTWLQPGLTACTAIVNHPHQDRYSDQPE